MKILAVDDERIMLDGLTSCILEAAPAAEVYSFRYSQEALAFAENNRIDVAFVDIHMPGMNGLDFGRKLMEIHPDLNLIFCTAYDEYISEAFRDIRCNGYIVKPVDAEQIINELNHLRVPLKQEQKNRIRVQCFGRFEVYLDGQPVKFESGKTKELLAYLVDNCGGICGNQEIIAVLWDDDGSHDSYFKKIRKDLQDTLARYDCEDILWRQRGGIGINKEKIDCDLYEWKKENEGKYPGDYMIQYSWANIPEYEW